MCDELISEIKKMDKDELNNFLKYEEDEEDRKELEKSILKLKQLEKNILFKHEENKEDRKELEESISKLKQVEENILFKNEEDRKEFEEGLSKLKDLQNKISELKKLEEEIFSKTESLNKKQKEKIEAKIKHITYFMIFWCMAVIFISAINSEWFSLFASGGSIVALVYTILFYILHTGQALQRVRGIKESKRLSQLCIMVFIGAAGGFLLRTYPQKIFLTNWLGGVATLTAFGLGILFFAYERLIVKWWRRYFDFKGEKKRYFTAIFLSIIGIFYLIAFPFIVSFFTITGEIEFKDGSAVSNAKIRLIERKDGKTKELASATADENGQFILQRPIYTEEKFTDFLITYDREVPVSHFDTFFSEKIISLWKSNEIIPESFWHTNKINYEKRPNFSEKNNIEIPKIPMVGKWWCFVKGDSKIRFIWKIDHFDDKLIIRQKGQEKTVYYFNEEQFNYNQGVISCNKPKNDKFESIIGEIKERNEMEIKATLSKRRIEDLHLIIICLPCLTPSY